MNPDCDVHSNCDCSAQSASDLLASYGGVIASLYLLESAQKSVELLSASRASLPFHVPANTKPAVRGRFIAALIASVLAFVLCVLLLD